MSPDPGVARSPATIARPFSREDRLIVAALMALAAIVLWPYRHFAGDDAYITFRFVRNLSSGMGYSFNPGAPTYGSTAPSWVFLLAGLHEVGMRIEDAAHALNWTFSIANVLLMWSWVTKYVASRFVRVGCLLFFILDPWIVRWAMSGMENAFALSLLLGIFLTADHFRNSARLDWVTPILVGLASLTRPEMNLLVALVGLDLLLRERTRLVGNLALLVVIYAAIIMPWLIYAHRSFGTVVPNTVIAKISKNHAAALAGTIKFFLSFWPVQLLALLAVALPALRGGWRSSASWRPWAGLGIAFAWAIVLPLFYITGGAPVSGRYLMYVTPCYLLFGALAGERLLPRARIAVTAGAVATVLLLLAVQYRYCWFVTRWPEGMDPKMIEMARYVKAQGKPDPILACDQIGVMGYFSDATILDTLGLVSPEVIPYRRAEDPRLLWRYVRERQADFLFVTNDLPELVGLDPAYSSLELIKSDEVQREGAGAAGAKVLYKIYRTNWPHPRPL